MRTFVLLLWCFSMSCVFDSVTSTAATAFQQIYAQISQTLDYCWKTVLGRRADQDVRVQEVAQPVLQDAFCRADVVDRQRVFEGRSLRILLDHAPITPGHLLIVPKEHRTTAEELSGEEAAELPELLRKAKGYFEAKHGTSEYILLEKNGKSAGQTVPHVHFHAIPMVPTSGLQRVVAQINVLFRILFGSSAMKAETLGSAVRDARSYFDAPAPVVPPVDAVSNVPVGNNT